MTNQEAHDADVIALAHALQILFAVMPTAAHELRQSIPQLQDMALFQPLNDQQIGRVVKALNRLLPTAPQMPGSSR